MPSYVPLFLVAFSLVFLLKRRARMVRVIVRWLRNG